MTKVDITTGGHTVIVECDADLDAVAAKALDLWERTRDPRRGYGFAQHLGGSYDRAGGPAHTDGYEGDVAGGGPRGA